MENVTAELLNEMKYAPGDLARAACRVAPAKKISGTLTTTLREMLDSKFDPTMGYIHLPLLYSNLFRYMPRSKHMNIIRLIKGGFVSIWKRYKNKPEGSRATTETTHNPHWYELRLEQNT